MFRFIFILFVPLALFSVGLSPTQSKSDPKHPLAILTREKNNSKTKQIHMNGVPFSSVGMGSNCALYGPRKASRPQYVGSSTSIVSPGETNISIALVSPS